MRLRRMMLGGGTLLLASTTAAMVAAPAGAVPGPSGTLVTLNDGKVTAFTTMAPDGGGRNKILTLDDAYRWRTGPIDMSLDGSMIAASLSPSSERHLYALASDGSGFQARAWDGFFVAPSFSPAGTEIAASWRFEGDAGYLVTMDTVGDTQPYPADALAGGCEPTPAPGRGIAWSPDGQWLAFITHSAEWDSIVLTDPAGEDFRFPMGFWHGGDGKTIKSVSWAPDSSQLVFSAFDRRAIQTDLWTVNVDGTNLVQITDTARRLETSPDFSLDGGSIVCVVTRLGSGESDVAVMADDGTGRTVIQTPADELQVAWGG